jgi:hypothetical protein
MAQRDQVRGALGAGDARQSRDPEGVALRAARIQQPAERLGPHAHGCRRHGPAGGDRLGADVDHARRALVIQVGRLLAH